MAERDAVKEGAIINTWDQLMAAGEGVVGKRHLLSNITAGKEKHSKLL